MHCDVISESIDSTVLVVVLTVVVVVLVVAKSSVTECNVVNAMQRSVSSVV